MNEDVALDHPLSEEDQMILRERESNKRKQDVIEEMDAFDRLPPEVQQHMRNAEVSFSSIQVEIFFRSHEHLGFEDAFDMYIEQYNEALAKIRRKEARDRNEMMLRFE